jgi:uncharacterized protein with HEPN domain
MRIETRAKLDDVVRAAKLIQSAVTGVAQENFLGNWEKQSAVEQQFIIIGEALSRIRELDPELFGQIPEGRAVIAFRNILVHGYDVADPAAIFELTGDELSRLVETIERLTS